MRGRSLLPSMVALALAVSAGIASAAAAADWTTYRHDGARSGIDPDSTVAVTPSQTWQTPPLDGEVYGQPLAYGSYVYVATENDTIYKLDAATGAGVWAVHLATPEPSSAAPCGDISPAIGITSTPVIDPSTNRIYAVGAVTDSGGGVHHELFALDTGSGQPIAGFPINVDPAGTTPVDQLQRAGLALDAGRVLIGFGGNDGDCGPYWGWLVSVPTDGAGGISSFQADPDHRAGAIWGSGNAPVIDTAGNVFVATGNGIGNAGPDPEYGDSVVKLNPYATPLDWWAPPNWHSLDATDADLGSSMPTLLPDGFLFQSGKDGNGYLLDGAALGGVRDPIAEVSGFCPGGSFGGSVYSPANSTIYVTCGGGSRALSLALGTPVPLAPKAGFSAPAGSKGPPTIAGGLVWVATARGTLYGLDPDSGAARARFAIPENGSEVNHFASPSAGGGRLFVASGDQVSAFTIAQPPAGGGGTGTANASGASGASASPGPSISGASISPRRFRAKRAATLRLTVSEAARVSVAVTQLHNGRLVHHRCSRKARRGKRCQVRATLVRLRFSAHAGRNAFKLRLRRLAPGHYTALIYATDSSGHGSRTIGVRLTILPPRPPTTGKSSLRSAGAGLTALVHDLAP